MARLGFAALAALVLGAAMALWVAPDAAGPLDATRDAPSELATAESTREPAAPAPVRSSDLEAVREDPPAETPASVASPAPAAVAPEPDLAPTTIVGVPTLPEEQRDVAVVAGFEPDRGEAEASAAEPAPSVDPERSGDLVRRMLALYKQMRD